MSLLTLMTFQFTYHDDRYTVLIYHPAETMTINKPFPALENLKSEEKRKTVLLGSRPFL